MVQMPRSAQFRAVAAGSSGDRPGRRLAARAGIRGGRETVQIGNTQINIGGDLIMSIDGQPVEREDAISRALARKHAGDTLELTVFRDGKTTNIRVKLSDENRV